MKIRHYLITGFIILVAFYFGRFFENNRNIKTVKIHTDQIEFLYKALDQIDAVPIAWKWPEEELLK